MMPENDRDSGCAILVSKCLCGRAYVQAEVVDVHYGCIITTQIYVTRTLINTVSWGLIWIFIVSPKIGWAEIWRCYRICNGEKDPGVVLAEQVAKYREVFQLATQQVGAKVLILPTYFIMHCSLWNLGHNFSPFCILKILDYLHTLNKNYSLETKQPRRLCPWYHSWKF